MKHYIAHELNGYFARDVEVAVTARLANMPSAQAGVRIDNARHTITLVSYSTPALQLDTARGILAPIINPAYSRTTGRHVTAFLREFCPGYTYYDVKAAFLGEYGIHAPTGRHVRETVDGDVYDAETGELLAPAAGAVPETAAY